MSIISERNFEELTGHKLLVGTPECLKKQQEDPCAESCPSFLGCYKFLIYKNLMTLAISDITGGVYLATKILSATSVDEIKKIIGA